MREGWCYKKLGEVCEIRGGATPLRTNDAFWTNGNIPWFTIDDIREQGKYITFTNQMITEAAKEKLFTFPKGTIMLCCTASLGACSIAKIELTSNQQFNGLMIKNREELLEEYLYYFATTLTPILLSLSGKATINFVSRAKVEKIEIPIPPLTTQLQIVSELDLLSHILDQKRQQLKEYDALAESIFYDMFGDPMENPKGWEMKKLGELFKVTSSKRILQEEWSDFGVPFLKVADLVSIIDGKKLNPSTFIPEAIFSKLIEDGNVPKEGDILVTSRGTIGHCYIVKSQDRFYFQDGMITWLSNNKGLVIPIYIVKLFQNKEFLDKLTNSTNKSTVSYLSIGQISKKEIPLPPLTLQHSFAAKIESIEHQKQLLRASIKETEMLFQSRMDYWFNS